MKSVLKTDKITSLLLKYNTCRIDIKNYGNEDNSIEIIKNSDTKAKIEFPEWFKNQTGSGAVIQSHTNSIDLKIKCINDGTLNITLLGIDYRDKNNNRFPIYIDFSSLIMNKKEYIEDNKTVWHDEPLRIKKEVKNNEIIRIHTEWLPFNSSSLYENKRQKI